ncbi:hypothetical protein ACQPZP_28610 [Spirillospora sp. CA-142024]|uniref:hypothetical protein n=1 Tax=Spirillospora sp. CA-142024 TaxID=3240036 RepID=UPI003D912A93
MTRARIAIALGTLAGALAGFLLGGFVGVLDHVGHLVWAYRTWGYIPAGWADLGVFVDKAIAGGGSVTIAGVIGGFIGACFFGRDDDWANLIRKYRHFVVAGVGLAVICDFVIGYGAAGDPGHLSLLIAYSTYAVGVLVGARVVGD